MAAETVEQVAAEFDGEDPLKPDSRVGLQRARAREMAEKLARELGAIGRQVELPAAAEEEAREMKAMLERNGCIFRIVS